MQSEGDASLKVQIQLGGLIVDPGRAPNQGPTDRWSSNEPTDRAMLLLLAIRDRLVGEAAIWVSP